MNASLVLLAAAAATAACMATELRAAEEVTAIDVLLLPDATMIEHAKAANARLRKDYPAGFALDATHHPHITLLQRYVRTSTLEEVYAAVQRVFDKQRPAGWELEATGYYYLNFNNMGLAGIVIKPTPQLRRLQQEVVDGVASYTVPDGTSGAYVTTRSAPVVNAPTLQYVATYVPERVGKSFNPHVTVGVGHLDFVNKMKADPFRSFKFKVSGAAVFHLGNFGTAQKKLWEWRSPNEVIEGCATNEPQRIRLSAISRQLSARQQGSFSAQGLIDRRDVVRTNTMEVSLVMASFSFQRKSD
jgi:hypothetical protein